jgi:Fic family protein
MVNKFMMSFRETKLKNSSIPMSIVRLVGAINEYKGKQELYKQQSPQILNTLKNVAIIQSTKASNSIEGIYTNDRRLKEIIENKVEPRNRSEGEIAGYRDVLSTVHTSYHSIPVNPGVILQLHRDLYKFLPGRGGTWKTQDNIIEEILPDGSRFIRFKPVTAFGTPKAMEELCLCLGDEIREDKIEPLMIVGAFVLDFLCINPFNDGNGRMARLLTLLLLYRFGYEVGRFISLEKIIEESKESYYDTLHKSSIGWHEGRHDMFIWIEYFLGTILAAYKEYENRVGIVETQRGSKSERVENAIEHKLGEFTKEDIRNTCPDVAESTINRVFEKLKAEGKIVAIGKGRNAKWTRL